LHLLFNFRQKHGGGKKRGKELARTRGSGITKGRWPFKEKRGDARTRPRYCQSVYKGGLWTGCALEKGGPTYLRSAKGGDSGGPEGVRLQSKFIGRIFDRKRERGKRTKYTRKEDSKRERRVTGKEGATIYII